MTNAGMTRQGLATQLLLEIVQLTFGAAALDAKSFERRDTRRVVATIFQSLE